MPTNYTFQTNPCISGNVKYFNWCCIVRWKTVILGLHNSGRNSSSIQCPCGKKWGVPGADARPHALLTPMPTTRTVIRRTPPVTHTTLEIGSAHFPGMTLRIPALCIFEPYVRTRQYTHGGRQPSPRGHDHPAVVGIVARSCGSNCALWHVLFL